MDRDTLCVEIQRIQREMSLCDPASEKYRLLREELERLQKLLMTFDEACGKQLEREYKIDLENKRLDKEFEFKEKEMELKNGLEAIRLEDAAAEASVRRRSEKRQAYWDLGKVVLQTVCTAGLIVVAVLTEQNVIVGQHPWSLIPKAFKV